MDDEVLSEIRNKLIPRLRSGQAAPKAALEKLDNGERVPRGFLQSAAGELKAVVILLQGLKGHT